MIVKLLHRRCLFCLRVKRKCGAQTTRGRLFKAKHLLCGRCSASQHCLLPSIRTMLDLSQYALMLVISRAQMRWILLMSHVVCVLSASSFQHYRKCFDSLQRTHMQPRGISIVLTKFSSKECLVGTRNLKRHLQRVVFLASVLPTWDQWRLKGKGPCIPITSFGLMSCRRRWNDSDKLVYTRSFDKKWSNTSRA